MADLNDFFSRKLSWKINWSGFVFVLLIPRMLLVKLKSTLDFHPLYILNLLFVLSHLLVMHVALNQNFVKNVQVQMIEFSNR